MNTSELIQALILFLVAVNVLQGPSTGMNGTVETAIGLLCVAILWLVPVYLVVETVTHVTSD
jgi:hypothetical protein